MLIGPFLIMFSSKSTEVRDKNLFDVFYDGKWILFEAYLNIFVKILE